MNNEPNQKLNIPDELRGFVETFVDNFIKWDIVRFFHNNPQTVANAKNIAIALGRLPEDIIKELQQLSQKGFFIRYGEGKYPVYTLTKDEEVRQQLRGFIDYCETQEGRFNVLNKILRQRYEEPSEE